MAVETNATPAAPDEAGPKHKSAGRTGRPKQWTDQRQRRLARLYLFSGLHIDEILAVLQDGVWKPWFVAPGTPRWPFLALPFPSPSY